MGIIWKGPQWLVEAKDGMKKRLVKACISLQNSIKKNLSQKAARDANGNYITGDSLGDFPHLRSGELRRSISYEIDESNLVGRVGTGKIYGRFLELSTAHMQAREFLERTLEEEKATIKDILTK